MIAFSAVEDSDVLCVGAAVTCREKKNTDRYGVDFTMVRPERTMRV